MHPLLRLSVPALFALALPLVVGCGGSDDPGSDAVAGDDDALAQSFADSSMNLLYTKFFEPKRTFGGDFWIDALALHAVLDGVERSSGATHAKYVGYVAPIVASIKSGSGLQEEAWASSSCGRYYDDINWMLLALVRAYDETHSIAYLVDAEASFDTLLASVRHGRWTTVDFDGIFWKDANHAPKANQTACAFDGEEKATASNFGTVISAARLYARTSDASKKATYKSYATTVYDYWFKKMVDLPSYHVNDHLTGGGAKATDDFTYNQGLAIGAALGMARIATAEGQTAAAATYEAQARGYANYLLTKEVNPAAGPNAPKGTILEDGSCDYVEKCAPFKGVAYRYLVELYQYDQAATAAPSAVTLFDALAANQHAVVENSYKPGVGFGMCWDVSCAEPTKEPLRSVAAGTIALNMYAGLTLPK